MVWFKIDDGLWGHPKWLATPPSARALWVTAGSWSSSNLTDGCIPRHVLPVLGGTVRQAKTLVEVGLWLATDEGWAFHEWSEGGRQPTRADVLAERERKVTSGRLGGLASGKKREAGGKQVLPENSDSASGDSEPPTRPDPTRPSIEESPGGDSSSAIVLVEVREDVERLCQHLAEAIVSNGSKRPTITQGWRDAARRLIDRDGRTEAQVHVAIDWCQNDDFWRVNILSMSKLREKYDQLQLAAQRVAPPKRMAPSDKAFAHYLAMGDDGYPLQPSRQESP